MEIGNLAQWAGATATFFAVLVALFKDEFLRWLRKPKLGISISLAPPDCHKTKLSCAAGVSDCYYLRIWVTNDGKTQAERVQVFAAKLEKRNADGRFKETESFMPMSLCWSYGHHGHREVFAEALAPRMGKHCDLGHVVDPEFRSELHENLPDVQPDKTILALDTEFSPNTLGHLVVPGVYRLELRVAAANCLPVTHVLELTVTGTWFPDSRKMFCDGLGVKVLR